MKVNGYFISMFVVLFGLGIACRPPVDSTKDYTKFNAEIPRSILIVPVINKSVDVTASDYFLATISKPVAERGYYVYPVNLVKRVLEDDGLADANLVHSANPKRLGALFGSDTILYITIDDWTAKYAVFSTSVHVAFKYSLKSGKTGEELWSAQESMVYTPQSSSTGNPIADLLSAAITAGVAKAAPNYIPLAQQANGNAVFRVNQGLPIGPYAIKSK